MDFAQGLLDRIKSIHKKKEKQPTPKIRCNQVAHLQNVTIFILIKGLQHKCLPVNFPNFPFFEEIFASSYFCKCFFI